jgi:hypothetical protein
MSFVCSQLGQCCSLSRDGQPYSQSKSAGQQFMPWNIHRRENQLLMYAEVGK